MNSLIQEAHGLLFSATSVAEVAIRLALATVLFTNLGFALAPRARILLPERALAGLLIGFYLVHLGSALVSGRPSMLPALFLGLATLIGFFRRIFWGRRARGLRFALGGFAFFALYLVLLVRADWPRFEPMSSDSQTYTWLGHQIWRYGVIPSAQPPMGPEPFHYPAALGVISYLVSFFSLGLRPLETLPLVVSLCMFWLATYLWRSSISRREAWLMVFAVVGLAWGILYPHREHQTLGRAVALPFLVFALFRPYRSKDAAAWPYLLAGLGPFLLSLNPAIAPLAIAVLLYATDETASTRGLSTWAVLRPLRFVPWALVAMGLVLWADPYFASFLKGGLPRSATMEHERPLVTWIDPWIGLKGLMVAALKRPFDLIDHYFGRGISTAALLGIFLALPLALSALSGRLAGLGRPLRRGVLLIVVLVAFLASFRFSGDKGPLFLVPAYSRQMLAYLLWAVAIIAGAAALSRGLDVTTFARRGRRWAVGLLGLVWLVGPIHGLAGLLARPHRNFPRLDPDTARALVDAHHIWRVEPRTKILLENFDPGFVGENFLFTADRIGALAFLPSSNPAFFYYQGRRDDSHANYMTFVCPKLDKEWLAAQGVKYVALGLVRGPRCPGFPESKTTRLVPLESLD